MRKFLGFATAIALLVFALAATAAAEPYPISGGGSSTVAENGSFTIASDGWGQAPVTVTLTSTPVVLGTLIPDANGHIEGTFTVPPGTEVGTHTIVLTGVDPSGNPRTVTLSLTVVPASGSAGAAGLAFTGNSGSAPLLAAGALAVLLGATLIAVSRRRVKVPTA